MYNKKIENRNKETKRGIERMKENRESSVPFQV